MRILIVDDDFAIRKIVSIWLKKYGECETVENGKEAVGIFEAAHKAGKPFDLICLDIMMPVMNGIDALKSIRKLEADLGVNDGCGVKVIMATAAASPKSIMGAFNEQCEAYLIKPIDENELFETVERLFAEQK